MQRNLVFPQHPFITSCHLPRPSTTADSTIDSDAPCTRVTHRPNLNANLVLNQAMASISHSPPLSRSYHRQLSPSLFLRPAFLASLSLPFPTLPPAHTDTSAVLFDRRETLTAPQREPRKKCESSWPILSFDVNYPIKTQRYDN